MSRVHAIVQPEHSTLAEFEARLSELPNASLDIAVAYITAGGLEQFVKAADRAVPGLSRAGKIRWLTSFDYFRTDPAALDEIVNVHAAPIRIHEGRLLLQRRCNPRVPFHPKALILKVGAKRTVIAGSGNMSYSGLVRGHEAGISFCTSTKRSAIEADMRQAADAYDAWFSRRWSAADVLDAAMLSRYRTLYDTAADRAHPVFTEDDVLPDSELSRGGLTLAELAKVRSCRHLWIEAGQLGRNRGRHLPGNQLMMRRMSRVFFGSPAKDVPPDTMLKYLSISFDGRPSKDCSLSFSNNKIDKLTLPIPGVDGPPSYDGEILQFERVTPGFYRLSVLNAAEQQRSRKASKAIGASFKMLGGRTWGVF